MRRLLWVAVLCACPGEEPPSAGSTSEAEASSSSTTGSSTTGVDPTTGSTSSSESEASQGSTGVDTSVGGCEGNGPHDYFDCLSARDDMFVSRSYRTQAMIEEDSDPPDPARLSYDADIDAAIFVFPPDAGNAKQLRHEHADVAGGNLFYYWEARWGAGWASSDGSVQGIQRHKAFQISTFAGAGGGGLYLEPRVEYSVGMAPDIIGSVNVRTYDQTPPIEVRGGDQLAPQSGQFFISADTWVRHWVFVDFDNQEFSYWIWAEGQPLTVIHDRVFHHLDTTLRSFWYEFNSSQERVGGEEIYIWGRNLVILRDLPSFEDAASIVALGVD